jgi:hypothetical protein
MARLALAFAMALILTGSAVAQTESPHCAWLRSEIKRINTNLAGLQQLVSGNEVAVMVCKQRPGEPWPETQARCAARQGSLGTWHDYETQKTYVILTKQYITDYVSNIGAPPEALARSFRRSEAVADKVNRGGVIASTMGELQKAIDNYNTECVATVQPNVQPLPVQPTLPVQPGRKRWY